MDDGKRALADPALEVPPDRPITLLLGAHDRLRTFGRLASSLTRAGQSSPAEVAESSVRLARFFDLAIPIHEADEEETLGTMLPSRAPELADALRVMKEQHRHLHEILDELRPHWETLSRDPESLGSEPWDLRSAGRRLDAVLRVHLALEENVVFPVVDRLDDRFQDELRAALWARRALSR